jgi:Flp pilus assembly protein TadB
MAEQGTKRRLTDRWWVMAVLMLVLYAGMRMLINGTNVWGALLTGAFYAAWMTWWLMRRRRRDSRAVGAEAGDLPGLERRMRHGDVPADDEERRIMRGLAQRRLAQMNRKPARWAFLGLGVMVAALTVVMAVNGEAVQALCTGIGGAAFLAWMFAMRRRNLAKLTRVERRLSASETRGHGQLA